MFLDWEFEPDIVIGTLLACLIYAAGLRRDHSGAKHHTLRHVSYFAGVASIFLALESPVDAFADHLFWVHQVQHMLLRMIGPMLIMFSAPQAVLIRGLPRSFREGVLAPVVGNGGMRSLFGLLAAAPVITVLFIGALYVWQYPPIHNAAILSDGIHYTMHITMLGAGLLFFWRIFDPRPAPKGLTHGKRLMMLLMVILTQIGLGAYLTLKSEVLYPAYDIVGRLSAIKPLTDELIGGFIIWVPSSMMCLVAAILVIHAWGKEETLAEERWTRSGQEIERRPVTGADLIAQAQPKNRMLAIGVAGFVVLMFGMAIFAGVLDHLNARTPGGLFARSVPAINVAR
ncbi:MAG TPA: cytochrome c oxidase assembly protein [Pseudolabrys sp.]|nr:cytochrome c oxidase assembly protein [Pseudolabrys sp.]